MVFNDSFSAVAQMCPLETSVVLISGSGTKQTINLLSFSQCSESHFIILYCHSIVVTL